jgi:hypothetical protein
VRQLRLPLSRTRGALHPQVFSYGSPHGLYGPWQTCRLSVQLSRATVVAAETVVGAPSPPKIRDPHAFQNPNPRRSKSATHPSNFRDLKGLKLRPPPSLIPCTHGCRPQDASAASDTASAPQACSPVAADRPTEHTSRTDSRDIRIGRASCAVGIFRDKRGNEGSGLRNLSMAERPNCAAVRRDRNFYRSACRIGERRSAPPRSATLPNNPAPARPRTNRATQTSLAKIYQERPRQHRR